MNRADIIDKLKVRRTTLSSYDLDKMKKNADGQVTRAVLSVTKARVLRRDKDRTRRRKTATLSFARELLKF